MLGGVNLLRTQIYTPLILKNRKITLRRVVSVTNSGIFTPLGGVNLIGTQIYYPSNTKKNLKITLRRRGVVSQLRGLYYPPRGDGGCQNISAVVDQLHGPKHWSVTRLQPDRGGPTRSHASVGRLIPRKQTRRPHPSQ